MGVNIHTYQNIKIEPFELKGIKKLKIIKKPNEHTRLMFTGVLREEVNTQYIENIMEQKLVKVTINGGMENESVIFSGLIEKIGTGKMSNRYVIEAEAVSHSKSLDIKRIKNSYQQFDMSYNTLMQKAAAKQKGGIMDKITNGRVTGEFILQYNETAWEFLKRMASRFNAPIIAEDRLDSPYVYIGRPERKDIGLLTDYTFFAEKSVKNYRETVERYEGNVFESDYVAYKIYSEKIFEIGDKALFNNKYFYIKEAVINMEDGILKNTYYLTSENGFYINRTKNNNISGVSLTGTVIDTNCDNIKVLLDIDINEGITEEQLCWFKFSTFYTSDNGGGFYCMPEIGEKVSLYFPDNEESSAFVQNAVRTDFKVGGERGNPDIKFFRTKDGKEIMFTPEGIKIRCIDNDIFINLTEKYGIHFNSSKFINLRADRGAAVNINAEGAVRIKSDEEIDLKSNGSNINMKNGVTAIRGSYIKEN